MPESHSRSVSEVLTAMYAELDKHADEIGKKFKTTCTKGCDSCCYLLATITLAEGILIAETLVQKPDWYSLVPKLRDAALAYCYKGVGKATYLSKKIPCVFLDTKERVCTIYDVRPGTCRYHYVVSNPANCHADHPVGRTGIINMQPLLETVWNLSFEVAKQTGAGGDNIVAPIPMMVLFCMLKVSMGGKGRRLLLEAVDGLPSPSQYLEKYHMSLIEQDYEPPTPGTDEELAELRKG